MHLPVCSLATLNLLRLPGSWLAYAATGSWTVRSVPLTHVQKLPHMQKPQCKWTRLGMRHMREPSCMQKPLQGSQACSRVQALSQRIFCCPCLQAPPLHCAASCCASGAARQIPSDLTRSLQITSPHARSRQIASPHARSCQTTPAPVLRQGQQPGGCKGWASLSRKCVQLGMWFPHGPKAAGH